ncbi:HTH domain-containing protein [Peribacillus saganii]|uniref:HTH domain-containing protein n=1 Tax=Peribacillus saganii TaxID=2303992 RepID=A0A372LQS3_9BACI|nr:HTH domain-containing protein [Peribacillus saganii]RFU69960.1 HTH domain-containing protein [Peribacillus saganii]
MNKRQKQIIHILSGKEDKEFITINQIAKMLDCSEKTVRNDFKQIGYKKNFRQLLLENRTSGSESILPEMRRRDYFP